MTMEDEEESEGARVSGLPRGEDGATAWPGEGDERSAANEGGVR